MEGRPPLHDAAAQDALSEHWTKLARLAEHTARNRDFVLEVDVLALARALVLALLVLVR